jgi:hypothetical protein
MGWVLRVWKLQDRKIELIQRAKQIIQATTLAIMVPGRVGKYIYKTPEAIQKLSSILGRWHARFLKKR